MVGTVTLMKSLAVVPVDNTSPLEEEDPVSIACSEVTLYHLLLLLNTTYSPLKFTYLSDVPFVV